MDTRWAMLHGRKTTQHPKFFVYSARSKTSVECEALDGRTGPKLHGSITTQFLLRSRQSFVARGGEGMDTRWAKLHGCNTKQNLLISFLNSELSFLT
ncbi:hypothetical protein MTsN2n4_12960 [Pseudoalteromonas sp. MTN2-4]